MPHSILFNQNPLATSLESYTTHLTDLYMVLGHTISHVALHASVASVVLLSDKLGEIHLGDSINAVNVSTTKGVSELLRCCR